MFSMSAPPWESCWLLLLHHVQTLNPNVQDPSELGLLPIQTSILTLSHPPVSYKCHVHSFIFHPSNVEMVYLLTLLASTCQIIPILQSPTQVSLFCQEAPTNSLKPTFISPSLDSTYYQFFSSDTIQHYTLLSNVLNCLFSMSIHVHQIISP